MSVLRENGHQPHIMTLQTHPLRRTEQEFSTLAGLLRILLIGAELRVEALRALLSTQEDMKILSPISDLAHVIDATSRMRGGEQSIDAVVIDWDESTEANYHVLKYLSSRNQHCLVISPFRFPGELRQIEEAGAMGYCFTEASTIQLANAIRNVARGIKHFYVPEGAIAHHPNLKVKRRPVFYRERLQARAEEIGWTLTETDVHIMAHFDSTSTDEIAMQINRRPGTVRTELSARIFLFLQLLSGRRRIPNKKIGFQVLLEFGIFEYK